MFVCFFRPHSYSGVGGSPRPDQHLAGVSETLLVCEKKVVNIKTHIQLARIIRNHKIRNSGQEARLNDMKAAYCHIHYVRRSLKNNKDWVESRFSVLLTNKLAVWRSARRTRILLGCEQTRKCNSLGALQGTNTLRRPSKLHIIHMGALQGAQNNREFRLAHPVKIIGLPEGSYTKLLRIDRKLTKKKCINIRGSSIMPFCYLCANCVCFAPVH